MHFGEATPKPAIFFTDISSHLVQPRCELFFKLCVWKDHGRPGKPWLI